MLLIVVLALGSALLYGVADFMSGVAARRIPVLVATTINYAFATVVLVIVVLAVGGVWSNPAIVSGVVAGVLASVGFLTFTAALAAGPISLMTPLIALLSSAVPVVVALVLGDRLEPIAWIAIGVAIVGSVLIGVERRVSARSAKPRTLVFAVISGVGFGFATVALDAAPADAGMVPVFLDTTAGLVLLLVIVGLVRALPVMRRAVAVLDVHPTEADRLHLTDPHLADPAPAAHHTGHAGARRRAARTRPDPRGRPSTTRPGARRWGGPPHRRRQRAAHARAARGQRRGRRRAREPVPGRHGAARLDRAPRADQRRAGHRRRAGRRSLRDARAR